MARHAKPACGRPTPHRSPITKLYEVNAALARAYTRHGPHVAVVLKQAEVPSLVLEMSGLPAGVKDAWVAQMRVLEQLPVPSTAAAPLPPPLLESRAPARAARAASPPRLTTCDALAGAERRETQSGRQSSATAALAVPSRQRAARAASRRCWSKAVAAMAQCCLPSLPSRRAAAAGLSASSLPAAAPPPRCRAHRVR